MGKASFHILRVGTAVTFLWIGILILKSPIAWGGYLMPWAMKLLPVPIEQAMIGTAILDIGVGVLLLVDLWTWVAAALGALHLVIVLAVSGITEITVRDVGLLAAAVGLMLDSLPEELKNKLRKDRKVESSINKNE